MWLGNKLPGLVRNGTKLQNEMWACPLAMIELNLWKALWF